MAGAFKKKSKPSTAKNKRSSRLRAAAYKGWETRRANEKARLKAAQKGARKRAANRLKKAREHEERSRRAKKGHATRKARAKVRARLQAMRDIVEAAQELANRGELEYGEGESLIAPEREAFHHAKRELYEAVDYDVEDYELFLDELEEELDVDWHISYGPGEE